ncbi:DUF899 domain-containing protein [Labrenzia sp. 011]|uniref:DUF899 domain-containing protein n=1 Tax=Labrenzia sp. 011 TaxID=2171494 RepID=UPI000D524DC8|nr:DUF899 domain-containing protein [Labrenzia sp. 011]PVB61660.1 DUF899 domain-containing protein [Labrenzia sp. 011]
MNGPKLVSREDWLAARKAFLVREKAFTRERDALAAARRDLPMMIVGKDYVFESPKGRKTLGDLFGPHPQLVVYHFMFGETWPEGCPSCSFWADNYERLDIHLAARDTALVCISNAPLKRLLAYRERMGWTFDWVSTAGNGFGIDFGVTFPDKQQTAAGGYNYSDRIFGEEMPGISTFLKLDNGRVAHCYSSYGRGIDILNTAYNILDLTPMGRHEEALGYPMAWVKRRDMYGVEGQVIGTDTASAVSLDRSPYALQHIAAPALSRACPQTGGRSRLKAGMAMGGNSTGFRQFEGPTRKSRLHPSPSCLMNMSR